MIQILLAVLALSWLLIGFLGWLLLTLVRQHGRALLDQEDIRRRLTINEEAIAGLSQTAQTAQTAQPATTQPAPLEGLPIGVEAPPFALRDLKGRMRTLADYAAKPAVLVFFNPDCGFCAQLAPRLGELPADAPRLVLISRGEAARNRSLLKQHRWKADVLLEPGWDVTNAYRSNGTPTGYLIDEKGFIASTLAVGGDAVMQLTRLRNGVGQDLTTEKLRAKEAEAVDRARAAGLAVRESTLNRQGLPKGTPAPLFTLPAIGGGEKSLADYRGRRVLLVFSDPGCGPCQALAPQLEKVHKAHQAERDLHVLMVTRGTEADNLAKVREHGLGFPVLLQDGWQTSRDYGMFATPVGYLIDETGVVSADVAVGSEAILQLVNGGY